MKRLFCVMLGVGILVACGRSVLAEQNAPQVAEERIVLHTSMGDLVLALWPEVAPQHVEQLLTLARLGAYDTMRAHYVDPSFIIQFSGARDRLTPLTAEQTRAIHPLQAEFSQLPHRRGVLSMARQADDPDSAETSFCILLADAPHLDGAYTIFGSVESGDAVLWAISFARTNLHFEPIQPIIVQRAEVVSKDQLAQMSLRPPNPQTMPPSSPGAIVAFGGLTTLGLAIFLLAGHGGITQVVGSFGLLGVLAGTFGLFVLLVPRSGFSDLMSMGIFFGTIGIFRLMATFERPRRVWDNQ